MPVDDTDTNSSEPPKPKSKPKRSIFKKSAWAAADDEEEKSKDGEDNVSFFSRRDEVFADVLAEKARLRREEQQRHEAELEQERIKLETRKTPPPTARSDPSSQGSKRRRVSHDGDDGSPLSPVGVETSNRLSSHSPCPTDPKDDKPVFKFDRIAPSVELDHTKPSSVSPNGNQILIDSDSDSDDVKIVRSRTREADEEEEEAAEEEFPELVELARARARREGVDSKTPGSEGRSGSNDQTSQEPNFPVSILITSVIDDSTPLVVARKLGQRLMEARLVWCDRQRYDGQPWPEEYKRSVFLTWKMNRLFDFTTCRSLGLKVDPTGSFLIDTEGHGFQDGRIHLEAWTEDLYKEHRELRNKQKYHYADQSEDESDQLKETSQPPEAENLRLKVILRSKDYPELKVIVRKFWKAERCIAFFRKTHKIPPEKDVSLYFDGEKLEPDLDLGDAGLDEEEQDYIEVYIR